MKLSKNSWHYKNFVAWQNNTLSRHNRDLRGWHNYFTGEDIPARQPDLCTYTRIALFYGPVHRVKEAIESSSIVTKWILSAITYYLIVVGVGFFASALGEEGIPRWLIFTLPLMIAAGLGVILGLILAVFYAQDELWPKFQQWRSERRGGEVSDKEDKPNVVVEFIKAKKRKICPLLEFEEV